MPRPPPCSTLFPYTTLFRSAGRPQFVLPARRRTRGVRITAAPPAPVAEPRRSEEHTSELQSLRHLVCRLLLEKKKQTPESRTRPARQVGRPRPGQTEDWAGT